MQVVVTLLARSATCEKCFSAMKRDLHPSQNRFYNLTILYIEKDISIDNEVTLNIFAEI